MVYKQKFNRNPDLKELHEVDQKLLPAVRNFLRGRTQPAKILDICEELGIQGLIEVTQETRLYREHPDRIRVSDIIGALVKSGELQKLMEG